MLGQRNLVATFIGAIAAVMGCGGVSAQGSDVLLTVDLTVTNQVTISATDGLSAATVSGSQFIGVYFADFYTAPGADLGGTIVSGNLTTAQNPADALGPALFRGSLGADPGLNIFAFSTDNTVSFTAGSLAFVGSATWDLTPVEYADMLSGNSSGDLYFPADTVDDIAGGAAFIGRYTVIVPATGALPILSIGLGAGLVRRRR